MDFELEHRISASPDVVAEALLDERYQRSVGAVGPLESRELLSQKKGAGGSVVRRVRCVLGVDLGAARKFIGDADPAWVEEATWDPGAGSWTWEIQPEAAANLLESSGTIRIDGSGDKTVRIVTGMVKVKIPLYGGKVERMIVDGIEKSYDEEAERLAKWLGDGS
jgi:hypothetical protein